MVDPSMMGHRLWKTLPNSAHCRAHPSFRPAAPDLSNQQRLRLEEKGEFPHRVYIAPTIVAYYDDEIDEWIASRVRKGGRPVVRNPTSKGADAARGRRCSGDPISRSRRRSTTTDGAQISIFQQLVGHRPE
jgi:Prophage CP4-57 regulatory protein (AlpA)